MEGWKRAAYEDEEQRLRQLQVEAIAARKDEMRTKRDQQLGRGGR
jgi:hypothetical protein